MQIPDFHYFRQKKSKQFAKKADIYQYYHQNGTKLSSMDRIALLIEKKLESAVQLNSNKF